MNRLAELLKEKRMSCNDEGPANYLEGLNAFIDKFLRPGDRIAEIGSFEGASTELFAFRLGWVWSIDPYDLGEYTQQEGLHNIVAAEKRWLQRMVPYTNVTKMKLSSQDAVGKFEDSTLDAVYIDGDHRKHAFIADVRAYWPKIKLGGVIAGHDYYDDIEVAAKEIFGDRITTFPDSTWAVRKTAGRILL